MEGLLKSTKIPFFDGKQEKFSQWSYTFLSVCAIAGCKNVLIDDKVNIPKESEDLDPTVDIEKCALRKANATAYAMLTVVIKDTTGFQAVRNGCTTDNPNGLARLAWKNLVRIYQPKSTTQKFELEQKFNHCQLTKDSKNPDEWFTELEHIRLLLKEDHELEYDDDKMIQHIIYNIKPKCYETIISMLKRDLGKKVAIELEEMKEEIRQVYGSLKKEKEKTPETALAAGQFKGKCRVCGKQGHKGNDCWTLEKNKNKRPKNYKPKKKEENGEEKTAETANATTNNTSVDRANLTCNYCKRNGHDEQRCFKKLRDLSNSNTANTTTTSTPSTSTSENCDILLSTMDYCNFISVNDDKMSKYSFIADSGASSHMVYDKNLLHNFIQEEGTVKVGDNRKIISKGYGSYSGIHINKFGKKIRVFFKRVLLVPDLWTNLFSITQATSQGNTKVICEENLITVQSGETELHFNKCLTHGKGKVLAADFNQDLSLQEFDDEVANTISQRMDYKDLHDILGHANKKVIDDTARRLRVTVTGVPENIKCPECSLAKIRIRNFGTSTDPTTEVGEKISLDISSVRTVSYGGAKFWLLLQDHYTDYLWSFFINSKRRSGRYGNYVSNATMH